GWSQRPFLGAFVEQGMKFNHVGDPADPNWSARAVVPPLSRLLAVEGVPVYNSADLGAQLAGRQAGQTVRLDVQLRTGELRSYTVRLSVFPLADFGRHFVAPYLVGFLYLAVGMWIYRLRGGEAAGRAFALACALAAITVGALFDMYTTHWFSWAWTFALPNSTAAVVTLGLLFPEPARFVRRFPRSQVIAFFPAIITGAVGVYLLYAPGVDPYAHIPIWQWSYYSVGPGLLFFLGMALYRWRTAPSPTAREQGRVIFIFTVIGFTPLVLWVLQTALSGNTLPVDPLTNLLPLVAFPLAVAYAILRYRVLDLDATIGQGLVYAAIGLVTVVAYSLILGGLSLIAGQVVAANEPMAVGLIVFLLVLFFNPLRERLQRFINRTFLRGSRSAMEALEAFSHELTHAAGLSDIAAKLTQNVQDVLRPAHLHLFVYDTHNDDYAALPDQLGQPTTEIRFARDGPLATYLTEERRAIFLTAGRPLPTRLLRDRARMAVLGSELFMPLFGQSNLVGWLAIGAKLSGEPFNSNDLRYLEALADQAALAIERASVVNDLQRRVKELNVVSQISQAVSFTTAYDDLLELIYAQTSKLMDTRYYYLLLKDRADVPRYAFFVENNERLSERENQAVPVDVGLESEILRTGQPIRTGDYAEECHRRGVRPGTRPFRAWMGVPLNTGTTTLGAIIVATTDPAVVYTEDHLKVFWTIADQAASAITKARLFQEAEQRARQLQTLNNISLALASTLELDAALEMVVKSAVTILNCEAGSLYLIDSETGEYVFRVAVGPVGHSLVGTRLPPGQGLVGEAIESGNTIIRNDPQHSPRWHRATDESTGFQTRSIITVPLRVQGRSIGAIQLLNKRDGLPFDEADQNLLTAFAIPAASAIENARLFTQTDQALAARVEELSMLQRIGRELNTTLDAARITEIALQWARRITGATAGWVGLVREAGIHVLAVEGYGEATPKLHNRLLPLDADVPGLVLRTKAVHLARNVATDPHYLPLRDATRTQLTVPIQRDREVLGLITLDGDTPDALTDDHAAIVTRLADLAAIALTNSRLYAEVQAANLAKSDQMAFVAHELKTPMTPIKGWADILLTGGAGPLNDMQKQFLTIIRNNIERMATIVQDIDFAAKLEAGKMRLDLKAISFKAVVDDVVNTSRSVIENKKQTLVLDIPDELPPVWADYVRTVQILTNLVSNAHKYTPEGGRLTVRVRRTPDPWQAENPPGEADGASRPAEVLHVSVQDTGIGISPEDQKKLFQKFFRANDHLAREMAPGTGLGLSIVKNLVEMQGGRIWVESEFRNGSTFHFTLPLAPAHAETVSLSPSPA
ncbi:MAG: GAF domain-containing protein, partial [Anaerolineales bacterium]|nr:GAF domain-containing protein [Anaerolineales bacterium]